jgi:hypothetical protein
MAGEAVQVGLVLVSSGVAVRRVAVRRFRYVGFW